MQGTLSTVWLQMLLVAAVATLGPSLSTNAGLQPSSLRRYSTPALWLLWVLFGVASAGYAVSCVSLRCGLAAADTRQVT
jgi:hypothetical protein